MNYFDKKKLKLVIRKYNLKCYKLESSGINLLNLFFGKLLLLIISNVDISERLSIKTTIASIISLFKTSKLINNSIKYATYSINPNKPISNKTTIQSGILSYKTIIDSLNIYLINKEDNKILDFDILIFFEKFFNHLLDSILLIATVDGNLAINEVIIKSILISKEYDKLVNKLEMIIEFRSSGSELSITSSQSTNSSLNKALGFSKLGFLKKKKSNLYKDDIGFSDFDKMIFSQNTTKLCLTPERVNFL